MSAGVSYFPGRGVLLDAELTIAKLDRLMSKTLQNKRQKDQQVSREFRGL